MKVRNIDLSGYEKISQEKNDTEKIVSETTRLTKNKISNENNELFPDPLNKVIENSDNLDNTDNTDNADNTLFDFPTEKDISIRTDSSFDSRKNQKNSKNSRLNIIRKGNMIMCLYNKKGEPLIVIGPHWPFAICMITFIDIISFCFFHYLWNSIYWIVRYIGVVIAFLQTMSYLLVFLYNPGVPPKELWIENYFKEQHESDEPGSYRICNLCKIIMRVKDNTDHCEECNICIIGADHHCPWTSKCVGKNNKKIFYIFIGFTFGLIIYFFIALFSMIFVEEDSKKKFVLN